jgi:hypothetical protein
MKSIWFTLFVLALCLASFSCSKEPTELARDASPSGANHAPVKIVTPELANYVPDTQRLAQAKAFHFIGSPSNPPEVDKVLDTPAILNRTISRLKSGGVGIVSRERTRQAVQDFHSQRTKLDPPNTILLSVNVSADETRCSVNLQVDQPATKQSPSPTSWRASRSVVGDYREPAVRAAISDVADGIVDEFVQAYRKAKTKDE